jgi:hypothetical protein
MGTRFWMDSLKGKHSFGGDRRRWEWIVKEQLVRMWTGLALREV